MAGVRGEIDTGYYQREGNRHNPVTHYFIYSSLS